jgi:hypothetical protein
MFLQFFNTGSSAATSNVSRGAAGDAINYLDRCDIG